jgi:hypothetical protein
VEAVGEGRGKRATEKGKITERSQEVICYQPFTFLASENEAKSHRAFCRVGIQFAEGTKKCGSLTSFGMTAHVSFTAILKLG